MVVNWAAKTRKEKEENHILNTMIELRLKQPPIKWRIYNAKNFNYLVKHFNY